MVRARHSAIKRRPATKPGPHNVRHEAAGVGQIMLSRYWLSSRYTTAAHHREAETGQQLPLRQKPMHNGSCYQPRSICSVPACCANGCKHQQISQPRNHEDHAPVKCRGSQRGRTMGGSCSSGLVIAQASSTPHPAAVVCASASLSWSLQGGGGGRGDGQWWAFVRSLKRSWCWPAKSCAGCAVQQHAEHP